MSFIDKLDQEKKYYAKLNFWFYILCATLSFKNFNEW